MKMKKEHFEKIRAALHIAKNKNPGMLTKAKYEGHSKRRYLWDLLYTADIDGVRASIWICDNLYTYLDDSHIDTALKNAGIECGFTLDD